MADYIPALASVSGDKLGIAISTVDGQHFAAGDAHERFPSSQSQGIEPGGGHEPLSGGGDLAAGGKDPSGQPFNSLLQLEIEQGKPRNPFINAGALVVCDMLQSRLSAPRQRMLEIVRRLSGVADIAYDPVVARSEFEHSARNAAIAADEILCSFHNDVATVLQNYFHYCSLEMSCVELARTFLFLADRGIASHLDAPVIAPIQSSRVNALMMTSGMYQNAGEFARRVGLPAKSGVGGGIVAIVPQEMAIAVWSPSLTTPGTRWPAWRCWKTNSADGEVGVLMVDQDRLFARSRARRFAHASVWGKERQYCLDRDRRSLIGMPQTLFASGWRPLRRSMMASRRRCAVTGVYRPARDRYLLSRLPGKMACHSPRPRAERAGAGLYRAGHPPLAGATNECAVCALICI